MVTSRGPEWRLELYWVPLGAGTAIVRTCGRAYEALVAAAARRPRQPLFHAAMLASTPSGTYAIEVAPVPDSSPGRRGVVAHGAVGFPALGHLRIFRYEVRRWLGGTVPDLRYAVRSPVQLTTNPAKVLEVLNLLPSVPTPTWGRDELRTGDMWNSNSVVSWALARAGLVGAAGSPPAHGRAPGWDAGVLVAGRDQSRRRSAA